MKGIDFAAQMKKAARDNSTRDLNWRLADFVYWLWRRNRIAVFFHSFSFCWNGIAVAVKQKHEWKKSAFNTGNIYLVCVCLRDLCAQILFEQQQRRRRWRRRQQRRKKHKIKKNINLHIGYFLSSYFHRQVALVSAVVACSPLIGNFPMKLIRNCLGNRSLPRKHIEHDNKIKRTTDHSAFNLSHLSDEIAMPHPSDDDDMVHRRRRQQQQGHNLLLGIWTKSV